MSYTRMYDSPLLDELHNYYPALIYSPESFRNVSEVLQYVQQQTRLQFDIFSRGQREYHARTQVVSTPPRRQGIAMSFTGGGALQENMPIHTDITENLIMAMTSLLQAPVPVQQARADPVVVRPTAEQIASGTAIEIVDADEEFCAICQDQMPSGSSALSLNACDHRFHDGCIRTWLNSSVQCPVCRHDIREPASS